MPGAVEYAFGHGLFDPPCLTENHLPNLGVHHGFANADAPDASVVMQNCSQLWNDGIGPGARAGVQARLPGIGRAFGQFITGCMRYNER